MNPNITVLPNRLDLFRMLPAGAVGVEVGVWRGYNAIEVLNNTKVGKLFLVDAWVKQKTYVDPISDQDHEANLQECRSHLRGHEEIKRWEIVRGFSTEVARDWQHGPVDFAYIDADHSFAACLADLICWSKHVKMGGFLMGHDYTENDQAKKWNFGVIPAVTEFCRVHGWRLTHLTNEDFASYALKKE